MRSHNGTNFVGGNKELSSAISHGMCSKFTGSSCRNTSSGSLFLLQALTTGCLGALHQDGQKGPQCNSKGKALNDEGLSMLMCEVEAIVNSRPITKSSDDPKESEALTPNYLLLLRSGPCLPPGSFSKEDSHSRRRWRQVQYLTEVFWRR